MFKRQSANNEGGSSATVLDGSDEQQLELQKQASSWQKAAQHPHGGQPPTQMEIASVDSKESKFLFPPPTLQIQFVSGNMTPLVNKCYEKRGILEGMTLKVLLLS